MNLVRYTPSTWFDSMFNRMLEDWIPASNRVEAPEASDRPVYSPRVDVRNENDAVVLTADMPGVDKKDLSVQVHDGVLTISGEKKSQTSSEKDGIFLAERSYGVFKRQFVLPDSIDPERIEAQYQAGVLKVRLAKKPEAAPKQINIQVSESGAKEIGVN
jgi:HSP20 family protein